MAGLVESILEEREHLTSASKHVHNTFLGWDNDTQIHTLPESHQ
jgi:hypothetical protein